MAVPALGTNTPTVGSISWAAFTIRYAGVSYPVAAGNSAAKFVVWKYNAGAPSLAAYNVLPADMTPDDLLLFLNKNGTPVNAQAASVVDGSLIVSQSIFADALSANSVTAEKILAGSIDASKILAGSIGTSALSANAVTADKIAANSVSADKILANTIGADKLTANALTVDMLLANDVLANTLNTADLSTVNLNAVSIRGGQAVLNAGTIKNLQISGDSFINGKVLIAKGVTDPKSAPTVRAYWPSLALSGASPQATRGLLDDSANSRWLTLVAASDATSSATLAYVQALSKSSGARTTVFTFPIAATTNRPFNPHGLTKLGSNYYVFGNINTADSPTYRTYIYDNTWTKIGEWGWSPPALMTGYASITNDGTNLYVFYPIQGQNPGDPYRVYYQGFTPDTGALVGTPGMVGSLGTTSSNSDPSVTGCYIGTAGGVYGQVNYVATSVSRYINTGGGTVAPAMVPDVCVGMCLGADGVFHVVSSTRVWDHTKLITANVTVAYDKRDTNSSGSGTARTKRSPSTGFAIPPFAGYSVTTDDPFWDGTVDGANGIGIYAAPGIASATLYQAAELTSSPWAAGFLSIPTAGTQPATSNGFAARMGVIGQIAADTSDLVGALIELNGTGDGRTGWNKWSADGTKQDAAGIRAGAATPNLVTATNTLITMPNTDHGPGVMIINFAGSTGTISVPNAGQYLITAGVAFDTNTTGRRYLALESYPQFAGAPAAGGGSLIDFDQRSPVTGGVTVCKITWIGQVSSGRTFRLYALQNSGGNLTIRNDVLPTFLNISRLG